MRISQYNKNMQFLYTDMYKHVFYICLEFCFFLYDFVNRLENSDITEEGCCAVLSSALKSNPSHLKELDLSENKLGNDGVTQISHLLKMPNCKLAQLNLSECSVKEEGYAALASALKSNRSHVIELDLRGNDPGDTGVKNLTEVPNCKLK
uniref:Uncharacterized protein n=1 Tax=Astyanax mexicanus TaxID=7994 RepID=A0A3B1KBJ9_ASTMX